MTIASFCRTLVLASGPLPLDVLAARAVQEGVTRAADPIASVRSAVAHRLVQLEDGRLADPLWLLEGRVLTTVRLDRDEDDDAPRPYGQASWKHDLSPISAALRAGDVPLASGGQLRRSLYGDTWRRPRDWPGQAPEDRQLWGFRVRDGRLHAERIPVTAELHRTGERLAAALEPLAASRYGDPLWPETLGPALLQRLAADTELLRTPAPPLSCCLPTIAAELRARREQHAREAVTWRPSVALPRQAQSTVLRAAAQTGQTVDDWLSGFLTGALLDLEDRELNDHGATVLPLPRRCCL